MRRNGAVLSPWALALAVLMCATSIAQHAVAQAGLQVSIRPVKKRLRSSDKLRIDATIGWRGPRASFRYQWTALSGTLPAKVITTNKTLRLDAKDLMPGQEYVLELYVTADYQLPPEKASQSTKDDADEPVEDRVAAQASVTFTVNTPPSEGTCETTTAWLANGRAEVNANAEGWQDDDGDALQYRYFIIKNGVRRLAHNWGTSVAQKIITRAKPGDRLRVICEVRDTLGDTASADSALAES